MFVFLLLQYLPPCRYDFNHWAIDFELPQKLLWSQVVIWYDKITADVAKALCSSGDTEKNDDFFYS